MTPQPLPPVVRQPPREQRWLTWGGMALSVVALGMIAVGLFTGRPATGGATTVNGTPQAGAAPVVGALAPDFTLRDTTNTPVHLADLRGKPVILNFWYVACTGCKYEFPELQQAYEQHAPAGLVVLGIDIADSVPHAVAYAQSLNATYPLLFDTHQGVLNAYQVTGTPTSFFIDRAGVIRTIFAGTLDAGTLTRALASVDV